MTSMPDWKASFCSARARSMSWSLRSSSTLGVAPSYRASCAWCSARGRRTSSRRDCGGSAFRYTLMLDTISRATVRCCPTMKLVMALEGPNAECTACSPSGVNWNIRSLPGGAPQPTGLRSCPRYRGGRARPLSCFCGPIGHNCGSFTTFKNIAMRYAERGTVIVDVALDENKRRYSKQETSDRLWDSRHDLSPALMYSGARSRTLHSKWAAKVGRRKGLVAEHVHRYAGAAAPRWLRWFLRASRPDYAYVNHYFTMDYLRKLMLDLPIMLDIHDIQSVNYLHHKYSSKSTGRSETFSDLLEEEMNFFRRANAIAFVSADELDLVAPRLPEIDIFHFIAVPKVGADGSRAGQKGWTTEGPDRCEPEPGQRGEPDLVPG